jgi:thiamine biosynthesis lipoprotein
MSFPLVQFESSDPRRTPGAPGTRPSRRAFLTGSPRPAGDSWIRVHRRAMACRFEITLESRDAAAVPAARDALNEIDRLEDVLSVFRESSIISEINRRAAHDAVAIDAATFDLIRQCGELSEWTGGAFDITSTPLSRCWGFLQRDGRLPDTAALNDARSRVGFNHVCLDAGSRTVRFTRAGLELNLGAIGKGYALDRVAETMRRGGAAHALMSAGRSSMLAIGGRRAGWFVELVSLRSEGSPLADVHLRDAAIGTSGAGDQFIIVDGVRYGHVIDPRTGTPASGVESASVIASSAAVADALSTAFLVGGVELAAAHCTRHSDVIAIVTEEGASMPRVFGRRPGARVRPRRRPRPERDPKRPSDREQE